MVQAIEPIIHSFSSFEAREAAFGARVHGLIPNRHAGVQRFWRELNTIAATVLPQAIEHPAAAITSNPGDCLAFGTAFQVLAAAVMTNRGARNEIAETAAIFGLGERLHQPIRTLSGGETVALAMAKAYLAAERCHGLAIASPFSWLSRENRPLVTRLFQRWGQAGRPVELFVLDGEEDASPAAPGQDAVPVRGPGWTIAFQGVHIPLESVARLPGSAERQAQVVDTQARLASPCLLAGANGQGKSLVARAMAGAIPFRGRIAVGRGGRCRLLLQDAAAQVLMRSPAQLLAQAPPAARAEVQALRERLLAAAGGDGCPHTSLLAVKALLLALRLQTRPAALILDEPDWGLTRRAALGLVAGTIGAAHDLGVPLLLISHKPWWDALAASRVTVRKLAGDELSAFRLELGAVSDGGAA
jgi:energy-coupling factor transporter ATP-binding protein EcfA2